MQVHSLIYRSRPTIIPWPGPILDIARASERFNADSGLGGMLLFSNERYVQYIEGPEAPLRELWDRIRRDERHEIEWLREGTIPRRRLGTLPMGYFDADREAAQVQGHPVWRDRHDWRPEQAEALTTLLVEIAASKYPLAVGSGRD